MHSLPSFISLSSALAAPRRLKSQPGFDARRSRGVTLIEVAITLVIAAILLASAAPAFQRLIERQRLSSIASQWASDLQSARSESVLRNETLRMSVHAGAWGSCYLLHSGPRDQCRCDSTPTGSAQCSSDSVLLKSVVLTSLDGIRIQSNTGSIAFDPLHGTATPTATLRVIAPSGAAIHHVVNVMGRVRTCSPTSPGPLVPGLRPC
jgi:type IV fimbrial biogenesis protein FimT